MPEFEWDYMILLPPLADPLDGDGLGSYDTDELDALEAAAREREDDDG